MYEKMHGKPERQCEWTRRGTSKIQDGRKAFSINYTGGSVSSSHLERGGGSCNSPGW